MHKITFDREKLTHEVTPGANLREVMLDIDVSPYKGAAKILNCRGRGDCKTCKVRISPDAHVSPRTHAELARDLNRVMQMIDHRELHGLRLACQVRVRGDVHVDTDC